MAGLLPRKSRHLVLLRVQKKPYHASSEATAAGNCASCSAVVAACGTRAEPTAMREPSEGREAPASVEALGLSFPS